MTRFSKQLSWVLILYVLTGCSKAVELRRADMDDAKYREPGSYRIRLENREQYLVRRFVVTDSTMVIEELMPADERYRAWREELPVTIPRTDITSFAQLETDYVVSAAVGILMGSVILLILAVKSIEWSD